MPPTDPDMFRDRAEAGRYLGAEVAAYSGQSGGLAVRWSWPCRVAASRSAMRLPRTIDGHLDVVVASKTGMPGQPEFGIGAVNAGANASSIVSAKVRNVCVEESRTPGQAAAAGHRRPAAEQFHPHRSAAILHSPTARSGADAPPDAQVSILGRVPSYMGTRFRLRTR
jgi:hypothetical protein